VYNKINVKPPDFTSATVERVNLKQTVSETGQITADLTVNEGWQTSGRVVKLDKAVGDTVKTGDVIAELDSNQQRAMLNQAISSYNSVKAQLNLRLAGPSVQDRAKAQAAIAQSQASVRQYKANVEKVKTTDQTAIDTAQKALDTAQNNLQLTKGGEKSQIVTNAYEDLQNSLQSAVTTLSSALTASDNILGIDNIFANDSFQSSLITADNGLMNTAKNTYLIAKQKKVSAEQAVTTLNSASSHSDLDMAAKTVKDALTTMQSHLQDVRSMLDTVIPVGGLSQGKLDILKSSIDAARASVNSSASTVTLKVQGISAARNSVSTYKIANLQAQNNLTNAKQQLTTNMEIANAQLQVQLANFKQVQSDYNALVAPPRTVDVASLRSQVLQQAAAVQSARDTFNKTKMIALADGVLSILNTEVGQNVTANQQIATILSKQMNVEVDISESDIAKVHLNDSVTMTLDSFGEGVIFTGKVVSIDPAQTEISGVVYYKTKIVFADFKNKDVKPGMTANITILTNKKQKVLVIPERAILTNNKGQKIVRVLTNRKTVAYKKVPITTSMLGDGGMIEITSGLSEGQEVITFIK